MMHSANFAPLRLCVSVLLLSPAAFANTREILERDWQRQLDLRFVPMAANGGNVKPEDDARGGNDGVIDGKWGFHTGTEDNPWWQVDLKEPHAIDRIVIYNRCDTAERLSHILVLGSSDGKSWEKIYQHNGTVFYGFTDKKPLVVDAAKRTVRFVRTQLPGNGWFHLDEVEIYADGKSENIALGKPAMQSSVSQWSVAHSVPKADRSAEAAHITLLRGDKLAADLATRGIDVSKFRDKSARIIAALEKHPADAKPLYFDACAAVRELALKNPLLNFDRLLVTKGLPGSFTHMSDQYLGWWSRPGGGIFVIDDLKSGSPREACLTKDFAPGNFLRPMLSWDAKKILFAYCKYFPEISKLADKVTKANLPEESFYHLYEMNADGSGLRQLTRGKYNDFDGRYLPDNRIAFLSTRRGPSVQYTAALAKATMTETDGPECYVRCGGGHERPCAVYTLHAMNGDGSSIIPLSAFEMFEWTPAVDSDGTLMFARWDYIDRHNMPYMKLWRTDPDGTNPRHVYGNYLGNPYTMFEAMPVPGSRKIVFTAGAHHSISAGSLVLLDPTLGAEGAEAMTRITPEVPFPETETHGHELLSNYFAAPWPLSENYFLAAWSYQPLVTQPTPNATNGLGVYLYDTFGNLELLYRDESINSSMPIPMRPIKRPPVIASRLPANAPPVGRFLMSDVNQSSQPMPEGKHIASLRIVAVPPKTQPEMNTPSIGLTHDDPGKCVLGTVPVEKDGSAYFEAPANVTLFFQALDEEGVAVQTMRTATYLQPGQTLSCVGCHELRQQSPTTPKTTIASVRSPSKIKPGPDGSWPFRFDRLVFSTLQNACANCHDGKQESQIAATSDAAWAQLVNAGKPSLHELVSRQYGQAYSTPGQCVAENSYLLKHFRELRSKQKLDGDTFARFATWMDLYGQRVGHFDERQENELVDLRKSWTELGVIAQ